MRVSEVFLNESWAHVDIHLYEGSVSHAFEFVNFAGFDDEDVAGLSFEFLALHLPASSPRAYELDLVVWVPMRARTGSRLSTQ